MTDSRPTGEPPLVDGPVAGPAFTAYASFDLAALGYVEEEYFLSGQARAYEIEGERGSDGRWPASPAGSAAYTTRLVVRRPRDPGRFNGTVAVEWLNVSAGTDAEPDWACTHRHLIREGFAWAGVSAQKAGIDGGGLAEGPHLKKVNPARSRRSATRATRSPTTSSARPAACSAIPAAARRSAG